MMKSNVFDRAIPRGGCLAFQTITDSFRSHWHSHSEYEIVFIQKGEGIIQYGSILFEYKEGDLLVLGPWIPHEFKEKSSNHHSVSILFSENFLSIDLFTCDVSHNIKQLLQDSIFGMCFSMPNHPSVNQHINDLNHQQGIEQAVVLLFLLKQLSALPYQKIQNILPKNHEDTKFYKKYTQLQKILAYINQHLSEKLLLQDIANQFYVSKSYLSQLFSEFIHTTFTEYVLNQRLYHACRLLATSNQSITDISEEVGFITQSSFNRSFLKAKNISPREYRKRAHIFENIKNIH